MALQEGSVAGCCLGLPQRADSVIVVITRYVLFSGQGEISRTSGVSVLKVPQLTTQLDARTDDWLVVALSAAAGTTRTRTTAADWWVPYKKRSVSDWSGRLSDSIEFN